MLEMFSWLLITLIGAVFAAMVGVGSLKDQKLFKTLSKGLKQQKDVMKAYEAINSTPPAPKRVVVKRLRKLAAAAEPVSDVPSTK
jgi:hypothetical protein